MPGIRIAPTAETLRILGIESGANRPWRVRDVSRPLVGVHACRFCPEGHDCKTYHLGTRHLPDGMPILDEDGTTMVSEVIWHQLQLLSDSGGFEKVNVVEKPPAQGILVPTASLGIIPAPF